MDKLLRMVGGLVAIFSAASAVWAFDRDVTLNFPNFNNENFLDIKSYQLRPELAEKWHETTNGFQVVSGSLGLDFLYLATELRIQQPLTENLTARYRLKGEEFYAIKPLRQQVGIDYRFFDIYSFSLFGVPAYDKRVGEIGLGLELGKHPWEYIRVSRLEQAPYYNEKNFEEDRFIEEPVEDKIEGAYQFLEKGRVRFHFLLDRPLEQYFPEEERTFTHQGEDADLVLEYKMAEDTRWGVAYRGFDFRKARLTAPSVRRGENQSQTLQFLSTDIYWIRPILNNHTLTLGTRYDRFRNLFRDLNDQDESYNYLFSTWQVYGTWLHPWGSWWNLDYGLYVGDTLEEKDNLTNDEPDKSDQGVEAKLRISFEIVNLNNDGHLFFTSTWNVDNFFADFWDGGQGAYQTRF